MSKRIVKVSELINYLKSKLDSDTLIQGIVIQGEVSNFTSHRSGHWYFTLKDEKSRINCVMFASMVSKINFVLKDGDKVLVKANTSIFEGSGQLQLYITNIKLDGQGDLYLQFERLKYKLNQEGLFDKEHKKALPLYPLKIGLITGKNTAAREDVISTISRRWPIATVYELNVLVQGEGSIRQLIEAVIKMDLYELDVILMVRGGGSIEDLWSFNDEQLARTIYQMKTPLISGIGHEVDITIVDFVADRRAPTPTGAAEMATPNLNDIKLNIKNYQNKLILLMNKKMDNFYQKLNTLKNSYVFTNPLKLYEQRQLKLDLTVKKLYDINKNITININHLNLIKKEFVTLVQKIINENDKNIKLLHASLINLVLFSLNDKKQAFVKNIKLLDAYSPLKIMKRGFGLVYKDEDLIKSVKEIKKDQDFKVRLCDGIIKAKVSEVNHE